MGNFDRSKVFSTIFKMEVTTWLSLALAVLTFTTPAASSEPRVVCYYTNWSVYRPGTARFNPQNINPYLCTHLIYAFGGFTKDNTLKPFDKYQDIEKGGYAKFTGLKTYNRNLKTMLAIGGWNEGSSRFSPMVASRERRKEFVRNAIKFLRQNHFDGLDLDWEYPAFRDGGKPKDREHYAKLVKELREEFERESEKTGKPRLLLTMAVPAGIEYIQKGFDVKTLNRYLDWMNLLTYDYHSAFEPAVNHHAPLYPLEEPNEYSVDNELNIDYTIKFYLENGADRDKLVLGIPTYGRSYTLFNPDAIEIGSPADGPGEQGDATREKGYLAYYEICEALKEKKRSRRDISSDEEDEEDTSEEEEDLPWTVMYPNKDAMGPVAYKGNQWVGYDDIDIVQKKAEYVAENGLGGIMFWSIDNDDFRGTCHNKPYPLIEAAKEAYISKIGSTDNSVVSERPSSSSNRRRPRPKATTTTAQPSTAAKTKTNNRKSGTAVRSTTPSWNIITPEPPTTPDPGSDFKCTDEGFFQHPRDCKKYFWCLDSGPSNLGIVAHQFTCPSGLFFNKAADSCDFSRNVLCKMPTTTTAAPTTKAPSTTTTTRKPIKLSTKSSSLFRTTSTTTTPEPEEEYEDEEEGSFEDAEDPKVIKELIDLIKKVGGVEQLEKQLHLSESDGAITTTPSSFNKNLYKKVLERTIARTKLGSNSILDSAAQSRQRGPQNAGIVASSDKDKLLRKDRPQYTTINRARGPTTPDPVESEEDIDVKPNRARAVDSEARVATTSKPLQYVNIRRARPSVSTSDTADDTASRNALFERPASFVAVSDTPSSLDIQSARREYLPEYVTIRRQRPTTEETTTLQYQNTVREEESQETILEKEISSPASLSQPQYTSIVRARSTTSPPLEEPESPEPTTVLSVQISSLLNSPEAEASPQPEQPTEVTEPPTTVSSSTSTSTTTVASTTASTVASTAASTAAPRRPGLRRRGTTTSTTSTAAPSTTQVSSRNYTSVRRRRPIVARPNEITSDSDETVELSRKIRSTTPDSREVGGIRTNGETRPGRRFIGRSRYTEDSIPAEASTVSRGQFRPHLQPDELISLTPVDVDADTPTFVPRQSFSSRRFRGRTSTTAADKTEDSEVSAATLEVRRPSFLPRGRGRFTPSSTTEGIEPSASEAPLVPKRPAFTRFTPRPFERSTPSTSTVDDEVEEDVDEVITRRIPSRSQFGRVRPSTSTAQPTFQARKVSFPYRQSTTQQTLTSDIDEDEQDKNEDITLSESAIEEKEHNESPDQEIEVPKRRIIIKRPGVPTSSTTESSSSTEAIQINESGKRKLIIRRRPTSTSAPEELSELPTEPSSPRNRIRKIIRKKIIQPTEDEPEIVAKSIGSLSSENKDTSTEVVFNYGERTRPSVISFSTEAPSSTSLTPEKESEEEAEKDNESAKKEDDASQKETVTENPQVTLGSNKDETSEITPIDDIKVESKPEVSIETTQKEISLSENESQKLEEPEASESPATEPEEPLPETTTTSTTQLTSPSSSSRPRAPYRPPKRLFTSTTESSPTPSSRFSFSRKFNPGSYTSPATAVDSSKPSTRRPFSSRTFTRRPFTTSSTTPEPENEEYSDEILDVEPEDELVLVPPSKLFTRKPNLNDDDFQDSEEVQEDLEEEIPTLTSRKPYKVVNSNTFRTSTSTTELPKRFGSSQNRTSLYNRTNPNKPVDSKAKRVQNVPLGYNKPGTSPATEAIDTKNEDSQTTDESTEASSTTNASTNDFDMSTGGDDYLSMTETTGSTLTDSDEIISTNSIQSETATVEMEIDDSTDDFLEFTGPTTNNPSTLYTTVNAQTQTENEVQNTEVTTENVPETTSIPTVAPVIKTQFDKLFSVSRVVEVSSKLDKHRLNKNNESRLIEEGKIMIEKKPMVDKIGEVSRFSLIKIVEDDIPIYLTKYGHVYPVENPPDNPIRIDEGRNARALSNFADGPRENLVASESINEAYRHITKEASKANSDVPKHKVEHIQSDDFLSYVNDDKKTDKSDENTFAQWQFVPAAYENEQNKQNKAAKSFEIVTPRGMLTNPSTLPLEALFKTENPAVAKKINENKSSQPFLVYSASVPSQKEEASLVKLDVLKPEVGRSIVTFAKGQELQGASVDQSTIQYPISITVLPKTSAVSSPTTTLLTTSTTAKVGTSPIIEMLTTPQPTTALTTEAQTPTATEAPSTTETVPEEITTVRISPLDVKRKFAFPKRPNFKPSNITRASPAPRVSNKSNATVVSNNLKSNKTSGFNPNKSRFTGNRAQNVPVDFRKKAITPKITTKVTPKSFTTEVPRTTTERKLYFKPIRPNLRPSFVPRKSTTPKTPKDRRKPFLRRTKATAPPDTTEAETESIDNETSTNKSLRRGNSKFKSRKDAALNAGRKDVPKKNEFENGTQRPSLSSSVAARSERPTRNFVRRRLGGANATTPLPSSQASPPSTTASPSSSSSPSSPSSPTSRRPFRVTARRRPTPGTISTSTTSATTALDSEESLQDIGDTDSIEDPAHVPRFIPKTTVKIQRRPLVSLKDDARDQNPAATTEEERKRQSKKYSSSIKQNQLEELKKTKSQEESTTAGGTTADEYSAETAVAIAAHQLLIAPVPSIPTYDEDPKPAKKSTQAQTTTAFYTSPQYTDFTESKTIYSEDFSTPNYEFTSLRNNIPTSTGGYEESTSYAKTTYNPPRTTLSSTPEVYLTTVSRAPTSTPSVVNQGASGAPNLGPSTARYTGSGNKYLGVPVEEYGYSTGGYSAQEPSYFTREYLLESPVTKTYDEEYQYLSPVTTPQSRPPLRKTIHRKISTTLPPTPPPTPAPRRAPPRVQKPFEKVQKPVPKKTYKPIENYDYYDDGAERVAEKYAEGTKVVVHGKGTIECLDIGNFPHPSSCKKFISCARIENGSLLGWEYICPQGLSFDPVGGICNWSAGLGCDEKDH